MNVMPLMIFRQVTPHSRRTHLAIMAMLTALAVAMCVLAVTMLVPLIR